MTNALHDWLVHQGQLLHNHWSWWKLIGWLGNGIFSTRFLVQWYATEKKKQVVVPNSFWWLSVVGSLLLLSYGIGYSHDAVFIFAYAFSWIPYVRNLVIQARHTRAHRDCPACGAASPPQARFCTACGTLLPATLQPTGFPSGQ